MWLWAILKWLIIQVLYINLDFLGVNDSEESSFRYLGKEQASEISEWMDTAPELKI
jgi:hypothetical protein